MYILRPPAAQILYAPPKFYTPPSPRRVLAGVGGVGVYKIWPRKIDLEVPNHSVRTLLKTLIDMTDGETPSKLAVASPTMAAASASVAAVSAAAPPSSSSPSASSTATAAAAVVAAASVTAVQT